MQLKLHCGQSLTIMPVSPTPMGVSRPVKAPLPVNEEPAYPETGGLFLFHKIPGVGDKFKVPERLTPLGGPAKLDAPISGRVYFEFRAIH